MTLDDETVLTIIRLFHIQSEFSYKASSNSITEEKLV